MWQQLEDSLEGVSPKPTSGSRWQGFGQTVRDGVIAASEAQTFRFHPAYLANSAIYRGYIYRR